jgi:hypothetical protein
MVELHIRAVAPSPTGAATQENRHGAFGDQHQARAFEKFRPSGKSHDVTILLAWACVAIAATIALYAVTAPDPADPIDFSTMATFP